MDSFNIKMAFANILIFAGPHPFPWNYSYRVKHALGGSETAVAFLSAQFPDRYSVYVTGNVLEETIGNVHYIPNANIGSLLEDTHFEVAIISRYLYFVDLYPQLRTDKLVLWVHDLSIVTTQDSSYKPDQVEKHKNKFTHVVALTHWHRQNLIRQYPGIGRVSVINNGLDLQSFPVTPSKVRNRFVFSSCPDRGLTRLLQLWPSIVRHYPDATLKIATYKMDMYSPCGIDDINKMEGVEFLGLLNPTELYAQMGLAEYWLFPSEYAETSCITAMEMMYSKVVCMYYPYAGIVDTVDGNGIELTKNDELFTILDVMADEAVKARLVNQAFEHVKGWSWAQRCTEWMELMAR